MFDNGATARASYSYADVDDIVTGQPLQNSPRSLLKFGLTAPIAETGLVAGLDARYVGSRLGENARIGAYELVDLTLTWPVVRERIELALSVRNVFDERYADPPGPAFVQNAIEQDGRTVLFRASFRY